MAFANYQGGSPTLALQKRIVLCLDGTGNASEVDTQHRTPSNVLLFARALQPHDGCGRPQVVYYMHGVGTDTTMGWVKRKVVGALGLGLSQLVHDAYAFLANNYNHGDRAYILGFSRGAAAARSLSGFTELFGVIPKTLMHLFPIAWRYYNQGLIGRDIGELRRNSPELADIAERGGGLQRAHQEECQFRGEAADEGAHDFLREVEDRRIDEPGQPLRAGSEDHQYVPMPLHFVGVWDTVFNAGVEGYHEGRLAWNVGGAYHALAIHELRDEFAPVLWSACCRHQRVRQVWFDGSHSDIGGGNGNITRSAITLHWMVKQALAHSRRIDGAELTFNRPYLNQFRWDRGAQLNLIHNHGVWRLFDRSCRHIGDTTPPYGGVHQYCSPTSDPFRAHNRESCLPHLQAASAKSGGLAPEPPP